MLNIDQTSTSMTSLVPYSNYCFLQAYGGGTGAGGWPDEKVVYCCNMGDNWQGDMQSMYNQARDVYKRQVTTRWTSIRLDGTKPTL